MSSQNNDVADCTEKTGQIIRKNQRTRRVFAQLCILAMMGTTRSIFAAQSDLAIAPELLAAEEAFQVSAKMINANTIELHYIIANGYYMYRSRFKFAGQNDSTILRKAITPTGKVKHDATFGRVETYRKSVRVLLPFSHKMGRILNGANGMAISSDAENDIVSINVTSQGCADVGVCYPPLRHQFILNARSRDRVNPVAGPAFSPSSALGPALNPLTPLSSSTVKPSASISDLIRKSP